ncbi:unnamed protein product [Tetraodon nigroviridis]|uniref:Chromosome undetermined SCAF24732, whole genome shotgun sequence n=1 Tax=Tetraodon nigroviridis TaxID=99883 RepID=Q4RA05_TETNG|nr:unnamed protein product [Tetraodon nigroviridis]
MLDSAVAALLLLTVVGLCSSLETPDSPSAR